MMPHVGSSGRVGSLTNKPADLETESRLNVSLVDEYDDDNDGGDGLAS
jgi:hypothetical protein